MIWPLFVLAGLFLFAALVSKERLRKFGLLTGGIYIAGFALLIRFLGNPTILVIYSALGVVSALVFSRWFVRRVFEEGSPMFDEARKSTGAIAGAGVGLLIIGLGGFLLGGRGMLGLAVTGLLVAGLALWQYWNIRSLGGENKT